MSEIPIDYSEPEGQPMPVPSMNGFGIKTTSSISKLVEALAKAQLNFKPVLKQSDNPAFMRGGKASKYADLNSVVEATREALAKEGLIVTQWPSADTESRKMTLITLLAHSSGEWMKGEITMTAPAGFTPQNFGSFLTYVRRYTWSAIVGVAPEDDDDGNGASGVGTAAQAQAVGKQKLEDAGVVPSLFYVWHDESQTAEITGSEVIKTANRDLLKRFWNPTVGALVVNGEQLDEVKYELEKRSVPFARLGAAPLTEQLKDSIKKVAEKKKV